MFRRKTTHARYRWIWCSSAHSACGVEDDVQQGQVDVRALRPDLRPQAEVQQPPSVLQEEPKEEAEGRRTAQPSPSRTRRSARTPSSASTAARPSNARARSESTHGGARRSRTRAPQPPPSRTDQSARAAARAACGHEPRKTRDLSGRRSAAVSSIAVIQIPVTIVSSSKNYLTMRLDFTCRRYYY